MSFKAELQSIIPSSADYNVVIKQFLTTGNMGGLLLGGVCCTGGPWLLKRFGWCLTTLLSPFLVLGSVILFIFGIPFNFSILTLGKIHTIFITGLKMGLLMPLIQIAYLSIPKELRFRTKGWAELVLAPLLLSIGNGVIGSLELLKKSAAIIPYFGILSILTLMIMGLAIYRLSLRRSMDQITQLD
ncbi:MAG: NTP/NDP exchange transporter [Rhabdochlamydiaceae bacterium]